MKKKNSLLGWAKEKLRERRVRKPKRLPAKPTSRVWWHDASVSDREKALKKSFGFKSKEARYLATGSFSDVFGDRNPSLKGTTMATKNKVKKRKTAKRKKVAVRRPKHRNSRPRRRRTAPRKPVAKRRRPRKQNSRRRTNRVTWPFPVTPQQKKKLGPWLGRITGRRVKVK